ncbi:MAG TPA: hydrogen peroxide-dependent heme synthase [Planctomycetaceae bacterium]|nr:hydrogen peroxide-dependent heme synthase [Planctomycetaceae bacterium]
MNRPAHTAAAPTPPTILMNDGWHCLHLYYRICQSTLGQLSETQRSTGREELLRILGPGREGAPVRLQTSVVSGHKAELALLAMDPDPLKIDAVRQAIRTSPLGAALVPAYSFVSITEVSEYVPTLEQYSERLKAEGNDPAGPAFAAKLKAYEDREVVMRKQRLFPDFPPWPVVCFYPMNKIRHPHANWYTEPYSRRMEMMTEHGKSGMKFAGKVSQLITASTGLDDWEWGVTLWAREPAFIKEIVYTMRFDEASAKYAQFGPFYVSYILPPAEALKHLHV